MNLLGIILFTALLCPVNAAFAKESTKSRLEKIADQANIANGDASVYKYKREGFLLSKAIRELNKSLPNDSEEDGCTYSTNARRTHSFAALEALNPEDDTLELLEKLNKDGLMKYMISRTNDGGESESCSIFRFEVYTTDGWVLYLNYDLTT